MKTLTTGCSFTHAPNSWANYLKQNYDYTNITNIAPGGSGNEFNIITALTEMYSNQEPYTHCITQISGINRFELGIDEKIVHEQIGNFIVTKEWYSWLKSTGDVSFWIKKLLKKEHFDTFENFKKVGNALETYQQHCYSEAKQLMQTLTSICHMQSVCKEKDIKDYYFCWKNEFEQYIDQIKASEELYTWYSKIDWSKFYFYNQYGGIAEWGIANGYTGDLNEDEEGKGWIMDGDKKIMLGHPSTECHQAFAEQIIKPWIGKK